MSSLERLDLSMNNFGGIIPECLGNLSSSFLPTKNNFHGKISCSLQSFLIHGNQFEGPIPQSLANCKNLTLLDVGNNNLNGTFPSWLGQLDLLQVLVLRSNRLRGHNIFDSQLLMSNSSFSQLRIIDLSNNDFSGSLPSKFFEVLHAMVSRGNESKGEAKYFMYDLLGTDIFYPNTLFVSEKGTVIGLDRILTTLTIIDLSNNRFSGQIPETLGQLQSLVVLNLSHNGLTGPIPSSLVNLSVLESFDLSSNKLQGRIPTQFKSLKFLEVFNVSLNNLVGPIPQGNQFDTFGNDSYIGNSGLCGLPLSKGCNAKGQDLKPEKFDDAKRELNWKYSIAMGYRCGLVFGLSVGYIVFTTGKPWWIVGIVKRVQQKYVGRNRANRILPRN